MRALLFLLIFLPVVGMSQKAVTQEAPAIESSAFDKMVRSMIKESVPLISVHELNENKENYLLLDARELNEYKVSHLEEALYIGYDEWDISVLDNVDKEAPIVIYCSIGVRSEKIGEQLQEAGFKNVKNLYGSIFEWANQGYPLVDNAGYPTMSVHGYSWMWGKWMTNKEYKKVYK